MASLQEQGDAPHHGPYFPPGSTIVAPMDLVLPIPTQYAPAPRILSVPQQLEKRQQILIQIKEDGEWVEHMIAEPLNTLTILVLNGRGYQNVNFPPQHVEAVTSSLVVPHSTPLISDDRKILQNSLIDVGFSIYHQFGKKYLIDERCEWHIFKGKWKLNLEKFDRRFEESQEKEPSEDKKKKSEKGYCEGVIRSYQQLGNFMETYLLKLLEERVNLEYKKWLTSVKLSSSLEEEKLSRDNLDRERVCVLFNDGWAIGLPESSPSQKIRQYMEKWPASEGSQPVEYYSITSDWIRTTCQNSSKIFGKTPELRGQERPSRPGGYNSVSDIEEEPYIPTQAPEEDQDVPERLGEYDDFNLDFHHRTPEEMLELYKQNSSTPKLSEQALPPPQVKSKWKGSEQREASDGSDSSTSRQSQDHLAAVGAAQGGQAMEKSSSSQPLMIPRCIKGYGDEEKTPPKNNGAIRKGECDEEDDGKITDNEACLASRLEKSSTGCSGSEPHSTSKSGPNADRSPSQALGGPLAREDHVREATLVSLPMSPSPPSPQAGSSLDNGTGPSRDAIVDTPHRSTTSTPLESQAPRPPLGQRLQNMNLPQMSLPDVPRPSVETPPNCGSEPIPAFSSGDLPQERNTQRPNTSASDGLRASRPPMGQRPANMNAWQADLPGGLEGARQRSIEGRSRTASRASQAPATPIWAAVNVSNTQVQSMSNNQGSSAANDSVAQTHFPKSSSLPAASNSASNITSNGDLQGNVPIQDPNGNLRQQPPHQRGLKRPASSQGHAGPSRRPPAPEWSQPMIQSNSFPGRNRMSQHPQGQIQAPVSSMMGGRIFRSNPDLTDRAFDGQWKRLYELHGLRGGLSDFHGMEMAATPTLVHGHGGNMHVGRQNVQSSSFAIPGPPPKSYTNAFQPVSNQQINQIGNPQNGYSNNYYASPQMPMASSHHPPMNPFATPQPQIIPQSYINNHPVVQQLSMFDPAIQAGLQSGHVQHGVLVPNTMIPPNIQPAIPQRMQQKYGPTMTPFHNNGQPAMARGPSQTPQPVQQNVYGSSMSPAFHTNGQPGIMRGPSQAPQPMQQNVYGPSPSMFSSIHNNGQRMNARGSSQSPQPAWPQIQGPAPQNPGGPSFQGAPGMSNQPLMMNQQRVRQAQSASVAASSDEFPSLEMNQASRQNSSQSHSDGSSGRRSKTSSGEQSQETGNTTQSSKSSTTPPSSTPGMQSQNFSSESDKAETPVLLIDPQTGKIKRKAGRPSKAQKAAEAVALAKAKAEAKRLADAARERETAAVEAEFAQYMQSLEDYWRNGDDLSFPPEPPFPNPIRQLWSTHPPPVPQEVINHYLNNLWNVTLDGNQVVAREQADAQGLRLVFPQPDPFPVLSGSGLLVGAYNSTASDETLFADVDFWAGSEIEKERGNGACEGARLDELL